MNSNLSRRQFMARLAIGSSLVLANSGCKKILSSNGEGETKDKLIRFYGTATLDPGSDVWEGLQRTHQTRVSFKDNGNDAGPVIAQMTVGSAALDYDIGGLLGGAETVLASAGAIIPWDTSKIANFGSSWQWAKGIEHTKWQGKQYGIPLVVNADSMIYLPDKIKSIAGYESGVIDSYAAIFDPRLKGRTSMEDAWVNSVIFTAIYLKNSNQVSITDPGNLTESELKEVMQFLISKKKEGQFRKFWSGWEQGVEVMRSGEVWAMTGWEPIVKALTSQGINAKYAVPKEGYEGWSIDLLLHAGAQKRGIVDLCHETANWFLDGYYGASLAASRGYAVPNDSTERFVRANATESGPVVLETLKHVKEKVSKNIYWQNVRPDNYRLYEEWWSKLRSA